MPRYSKVVEEDAESLLVTGIRARRGLCFKIRFLGFAGAPDRLVLLPWGLFFFVELKDVGGSLEESQKVMFPRLEKRGFKVNILYGVEDVRRFLNSLPPPQL